MREALIRTEMLLGEGAMSRLRAARVAVFGLGGVGGYVAEALARSGIGALDLIDNDRVAVSNLNRQIIATHSSLGRPKVEAARDRVHDIDPEIAVRIYQCFYLPQNREDFDFSQYDYVVDCIDTVTAKLDLVLRAQEAGVPILCAMGTGNKLDPSKLRVSDIYETSTDPLARVMRKELRRRGVKALKVVWSTEEPLTPRFTPVQEEAPAQGPEAYGNQRRSVPGSSAFVPPAAGLLIASAVLRDLLKI